MMEQGLVLDGGLIEEMFDETPMPFASVDTCGSLLGRNPQKRTLQVPCECFEVSTMFDGMEI
jgi:hypothetical protein